MNWEEYEEILIWVSVIYVVLVALVALFASKLVVSFTIGYWFGHVAFTGLAYFLKGRG